MQDSRFEKLEFFELLRGIGSEEEINLAGMSSVRKLAHKVDTIQFSGACSREAIGEDWRDRGCSRCQKPKVGGVLD
jgi:hypothetical protein